MSSMPNMDKGLSDLSQAIGRLIDVQRSLSEEMIKLIGSSSDSMSGLLRNTLSSITVPRLTIPSLTGSCCDIPEPCWMPRCLGEIECRVCPGTTATLRVRITNEDIRPRAMVPLASGPAAKDVQFNPAELTLGPKERGTLTAVLAVPATAADSQVLEAIVWIRGCRDYYLRWCVTVGAHAGCCIDDVAVCDGPDNILHWYDHFYCPRPCLGSRTG